LTKFFSGGNFQYAAVIVTHGSRNVIITDNIVKNSHVGISIGNFYLFIELKKLNPIRKLFIVFWKSKLVDILIEEIWRLSLKLTLPWVMKNMICAYKLKAICKDDEKPKGTIFNGQKKIFFQVELVTYQIRRVSRSWETQLPITPITELLLGTFRWILFF